MRIAEVFRSLDLEIHVEGDLGKALSGGVAGDLLSFVMKVAGEGNVWVTVQNHVNVAAVAVLKEIPFVLLASGRVPSPELVDRCRQEGITLATSALDAYPLCGKLYELGLKD
ncbi:MAG TPA: serine kinase [Synergistaceae bacterium]|nr:serine kinase [Synergistaceae bacterium]